MRPLLVGIAGPPCAGKSTLCIALSKERSDITHVSMEDFYKDTESVPFYKGHKNLDSPKSIEFITLETTLNRLRDGKEISVPIYSKNNSMQIGTKIVRPSKVLLVDGFLIFWHKRIRDMLDLKIYIDIDFKTQIERKMIRKLGNDLNMGYYNTVLIPMTKKYVVPSKKYADYIIDGTKSITTLKKDFLRILENNTNFI